MRTNVAFNGVDAASTKPSTSAFLSKREREAAEADWQGKVRVNEGDAW